MVKTDDILDSADKLISTNRIWVRYFDHEERIRNAPKQSFFGRLSKKKGFIIGSYPAQKEMDAILTGLISTFFFDQANEVIFNMATTAPYARLMGLVGFLKSGNYYETLKMYLMRKTLDETRKQFVIERWIQLSQLY